MSDQSRQLQSGANRNQDEAENKKTPTMMRWMLIGVGAVIGVIVVGFIIALIGGIADSEGVSNFFRILRDFFIIVLALQGILICLALVVLITQIAALINLLSSEVKPIIEETRETVNTARGTAEFVGKNLASPLITASSNIAGARAFVGHFFGIRRNVNGRARR